MVKHNVEKRGLPQTFYVSANLLKAMKFVAKTMNLSFESVMAAVLYFAGTKKEDLDSRVQAVKMVKTYSRDANGKFGSRPLRKSKQFAPSTIIPIPKHLRRAAISDKHKDIRVMDALICYYLSSQRDKLPWKAGATKKGVEFLSLTFDDCQSPNEHLTVFRVGTQEYRIHLMGVARKTRKLRRKKVGKTTVVEAAKDVNTASPNRIDHLIRKESASGKVQRIMRASELETSSVATRSSTGFEMGE